MSTRIIAVGYEIDYTPVAHLLEQHRANIGLVPGNLVIKSGVYYSKGSRGGFDPADLKNEADLESWFRRRIGKPITGKIRRLHRGKNGDTLVPEVQFATDLIYSFILNTEHKSTTLQKKMIHDGHSYYTSLDLVEPLVVPARAYKHLETIIRRPEYLYTQECVYE